MNWKFFKSFSLGKGFRLNLSKKGLGFSFGTRFFRIGRTADGRIRQTITIPKTGIQLYRYVKTKKKNKK